MERVYLVSVSVLAGYGPSGWWGFAVTDNDGCEGPCLRVVVAGWELVSVQARVRFRARMERL